MVDCSCAIAARDVQRASGCSGKPWGLIAGLAGTPEGLTVQRERRSARCRRPRLPPLLPAAARRALHAWLGGQAWAASPACPRLMRPTCALLPPCDCETASEREAIVMGEAL